MSGLEKVALLLKSLGPDATESVLAQLSSAQAQQVRAQMATANPGPDQALALRDLLHEIVQAIPNESAVAGPAAAAATKSNVRATGGSPSVNLVIADEAKSEPELSFDALPSDPLDAMGQLPAALLARALALENPRTVSLVLNHLDSALAGEVYKALSADMRRDISLHFASQPLPPLEVLRRIAFGIVQKCKVLTEAPPVAQHADRVKKMAELIRLLPRDERTSLLGALEEKDADTAKKVKDLIYQFEDLVYVDNLAAQKLLAELDTKTLAMAMKGAMPAIQHKIRSNLSKRAQDALAEEIDLMGNVSAAKVEQARNAIADVLRRLDERGELSMAE